MDRLEFSQTAREHGIALEKLQGCIAHVDSPSAHRFWGSVSVVRTAYERLVEEVTLDPDFNYAGSARIVMHLHTTITDLTAPDGLSEQDQLAFEDALQCAVALLEGFEPVANQDAETALNAAQSANRKLAAAVDKGMFGAKVDTLVQACIDANRAAIERAASPKARVRAVREALRTHASVCRHKDLAPQGAKVSA